MHLHAEFRSVSPFSRHEIVGVSSEQPWFFLFCWPLDCWENKGLKGSCPGLLQLLQWLLREELVCLFLTSDRDVFACQHLSLRHFSSFLPTPATKTTGCRLHAWDGRTWGGHLTADQRPTLNAVILMTVPYVNYDPYFDCPKKMA